MWLEQISDGSAIVCSTGVMMRKWIVVSAVILWATSFMIFANETVLVDSLKPNWRLRIDVSRAQSHWDSKMGFMGITPTFIGDEIYIPLDFSDAWRELDRMLPEGYRKEVASQFGRNCSSEKISDPLYFLHADLIVFLSEMWLQKNPSRLSEFLAVFLGVDRKAIDNPPGSGIVIDMILCGYYERESFGDYPKMSELRSRFKKELVKGSKSK